MRSPTLCLAAFVAVFFVVSSNAMPCGQDASYVKEQKSSSSTSSAATSSSSDEEVIKANGPCGQYSKESSSSSNQAAASSATKNQASFEAGNSKDGSFVKKDSSSEAANSAACASSNSHEKITANSGSGEYSKELSQSANQAAARSAAKSSDSYEASNCGGQGSYVKAKKSSDTSASAATASTASQEKIQSNSCNGDYIKQSKNSAAKSVASSSSSNSDSYEAFNGGGRGTSGSGGRGTSSSGGGGSSGSKKSCGCTTKSVTIEEIKKRYAKKCGEDDAAYYKRIVDTKCSSPEEYTETMLKIYQAYPDLDCWCNIKYTKLMKDCYTKMYGKKPCETDEQYSKRLMTKYPFETDKQCYDRLFFIHECNPNSNVWWEKKNLEFLKKAYESWYKKTSADVSVEEYYKRIVTKCGTETEENFLKRMNFIRNYVCPNLDLWYSNKYMSITKYYYTTLYTKQKGETEESYYKRIVKKEPCDTSPESYIQRMDMVHQVTVTCPVWCEETFYESCTKQYYDTFTKTLSIDKCEEERYKRIAFRYPLETEECYVKRMTLIQRKYITLKMWFDSNYYSCTKNFYTLRYAKTSSESEDARIERIFKREPCDTNDNNYHNRMMMIRRATPSCPAWYDAKYYENHTKDLYSNYYKKGANEACDKWLAKVIDQLDGESKECAVKRVALIKKCTSSCGCWTSDNFSKVKCSKGISSEYYELIKKTYFSSDVQYEKKSSSSSSSSCSASSSEEDSEVVIKRGVC